MVKSTEVKRKERTKPVIIFIYEDNEIKLEKDSKQWILTHKNNGGPKFYTYLPFLLNDIAFKKVENKIVKNGLENTINAITDIKRAVIREISIIGTEIGKNK
ncbi:hypothetical protein D4R86_03020 [bacterium]|nr:MAG: hypothetical protein D4R86_03020 [bacterium]